MRATLPFSSPVHYLFLFTLNPPLFIPIFYLSLLAVSPLLLEKRRFWEYISILIVKMSRSFPHIVLLLVLLISLRGNFGSNSGVGEPQVKCKEAERQALLRIKQDLFVFSSSWYPEEEDINILLSSWGDEVEKRECCEWIGIRCNNISGHVIKLDLSPSTIQTGEHYLRGNISSSLVDLKHLTYLDLSDIDFGDFALAKFSSIPSFIGSLTKLQHLCLSSTSLGGEIPPQLGNMTALKYLDLSNNMFQGILSERFGNLNSLTYLNLGSNQLTGFHQKTFSNMTALMHLDLSVNQLRGFILESYRNMDSLVYLDLHGNQLDSLNPKSFVNMTAMKYLYLQSNHFKGPIPENFGNSMRSLRELDLSNNMLEGEIPKSIWKICSLQSFEAYNNSLSGLLRFAQTNSFMSCANFSLEYLDLNHNKIIGSLPNFTLYPYLSWLNLSFNLLTGISKSIGQLSKLKDMSISYNSIQGFMSETHFAKLTSLISLDLSSNSNLAVQIHSDWVPPFQLASIHLGSCKLGPHFPKWLQTQKDYSTLDISNSGISDSAPDWLWDFNPNLDFLDLSNNEIKGNVKERVNFTLKRTSAKPDIDLSSNQLQGPIPRFLLQVASLNLFNNSFSQLNSLCNFTESIPLFFLDVSYNQLSGEIPDCWSQASSLRILILANNNLSGKIPVSIGFLIYLEILHLSRNKLTGEIPRDITKLAGLFSFNLSRNNLSGHIPHGIGRLKSLDALDLSYNHLSGQIPPSLSQVDSLGTLDLSNNNLSGKIPTGTLLQTQFISAFLGNPELCGDPLPKKCPNEEHPSLTGRVTEDGVKDDFFTKGFYISLAMGVVVGFWGFCGTYIFNKSFRYAYLKLLNDIEDWLYVTKEIHGRKLLRFIQS